MTRMVMQTARMRAGRLEEVLSNPAEGHYVIFEVRDAIREAFAGYKVDAEALCNLIAPHGGKLLPTAKVSIRDLRDLLLSEDQPSIEVDCARSVLRAWIRRCRFFGLEKLLGAKRRLPVRSRHMSGYVRKRHR